MAEMSPRQRAKAVVSEFYSRRRDAPPEAMEYLTDLITTAIKDALAEKPR